MDSHECRIHDRLEEARSRVDASVITGTVLLDSDDLMDSRAQQRAEELLTNSAILDVARAGRSFEPVEGDGGTHASKLFMRSEPDGSMLVAIFNYDRSQAAEIKADLARFRLDVLRVDGVQISFGWESSVGMKDALILHVSEAKTLVLRLAKERVRRMFGSYDSRALRSGLGFGYSANRRPFKEILSTLLQKMAAVTILVAPLRFLATDRRVAPVTIGDCYRFGPRNVVF